MSRLYADLEVKVAKTHLKGPDQVEYLIGQTVGPGTDRKAEDLLHSGRFLPESPKTGNRGIGIAEGLEIGNKLFGLKTFLPIDDARPELFRDGLSRIGPGGGGTVRIAEKASFRSEGSVPVGTSHARMEGDLMDTAPETSAKLRSQSPDVHLFFQNLRL